MEPDSVGSVPDPSKHSFLDLPMRFIERLYRHYLPLHSAVLLSHACRSLWRIMHVQCQRRVASLTSRRARATFLLGIAAAYNDLYYCGGCNRIHRRDPTDVPGPPFAENVGEVARCPVRQSLICWDHGVSYALHHHHVQHALKYARRPPGDDDKVGKEHFERLMKEVPAYAHEDDEDYGGGEGHSSKIPDQPVRYSATPRIIFEQHDGGGHAFLLRSRWQIPRQSVTPSLYMTRWLCVHVGFYFADSPTATGVSSNDDLFIVRCGRSVRVDPGPFEASEDHVGHWACDRCPMDYDVRLARDCWFISAWIYFGREATCSPHDLAWEVLVYDPRGDGDKKQDRWLGPTILHAPGSIRAKWTGKHKDTSFGPPLPPRQRTPGKVGEAIVAVQRLPTRMSTGSMAA